MKLFSKKDESFVCENCKKEVEVLNYTSRDHCPFCLYSKHVDISVISVIKYIRMLWLMMMTWI